MGTGLINNTLKIMPPSGLSAFRRIYCSRTCSTEWKFFQARSIKSLKRADFKRVLGTLFKNPYPYFGCEDKWPGLSRVTRRPYRFFDQGSRSRTASTRAQRTSRTFGRHMQKLHVVFRLLPGMFLRDKNILIKIK